MSHGKAIDEDGLMENLRKNMPKANHVKNFDSSSSSMRFST